MISIICVSNKSNILKNMLLKSLDMQDYKDFEVIIIDTVREKYKSIDAALNYGASKAKGDILVFSHQDIRFDDKATLFKINKFCGENDFGIAGVAGADKQSKTVSNILIGNPPFLANKNRLNNVTDVETVDECVIIIKKKDFTYFKSYNSYHMYGVEYSLRCKKNNQRVVVFPIDLYHLSPGWSLDNSYWRALKCLCKEYKGHRYIATTMGYVNNGPFYFIFIFLRKLKRKIFKHKYKQIKK